MTGRVLTLAAALALAGCRSYTVMQTNVFADDDGAVVSVDYARADRDHENTFVAPTNGERMPFRSKLLVRVTLPDGDDFTAWQCMNMLSRGTMYRTDDERWMFLANGFSCVIYERSDESDARYREVYRGVVCEVTGGEKESREARDKWKTVPGSRIKTVRGTP